MEFKITIFNWNEVIFFALLLPILFIISFGVLKVIFDKFRKFSIKDLLNPKMILLLGFFAFLAAGSVDFFFRSIATIYDIHTGQYGVVIEDVPEKVEKTYKCGKVSRCEYYYTFKFYNGKEYTFRESELGKNYVNIIENGDEYIVRIFATRHDGIAKIQIESVSAGGSGD